jgi:uncharacterized protein (DUF849 family)
MFPLTERQIIYSARDARAGAAIAHKHAKRELRNLEM